MTRYKFEKSVSPTGDGGSDKEFPVISFKVMIEHSIITEHSKTAE